jgi:hypothetical protein
MTGTFICEAGLGLLSGIYALVVVILGIAVSVDFMTLIAVAGGYSLD